MTEQEALDIVNSKSATVSLKGMQSIIDALAQSAADQGDNLERKTLGEYSYNDGTFGVMFNKALMSETIECLRYCGYHVTEGFNDEIRIEW